MKPKFKILLELGSLYLVTSNLKEASKYFDMVLDEAVKVNDLLLESLAAGNLGLCRQREGDFSKAIDYFRKQKTVLQSELSRRNSDPRELIPIRIDIARADAKIAKCYQSIGNSSRVESHLKEYKSECEKLLNEYSKVTSDHLLKELKDQIYIDYDKSLEELSLLYLDKEKFDLVVDYADMRLRSVEQSGLDERKAKEIKIHAYFALAQMFFKKHKVNIFF